MEEQRRKSQETRLPSWAWHTWHKTPSTSQQHPSLHSTFASQEYYISLTSHSEGCDGTCDRAWRTFLTQNITTLNESMLLSYTNHHSSKDLSLKDWRKMMHDGELRLGENESIVQCSDSCLVHLCLLLRLQNIPLLITGSHFFFPSFAASQFTFRPNLPTSPGTVVIISAPIGDDYDD